MSWISISFLTLALVLSTTSAQANGPRPTHDPRAAHAQADLNGDADVDKTGFLKPEELNKATVVEEDFSEADLDGDGKISLYEFIEYRFDDFDAADTDANGLLSVDEVIAAFES